MLASCPTRGVKGVFSQYQVVMGVWFQTRPARMHYIELIIGALISILSQALICIFYYRNLINVLNMQLISANLLTRTKHSVALN